MYYSTIKAARCTPCLRLSKATITLSNGCAALPCAILHALKRVHVCALETANASVLAQTLAFSRMYRVVLLKGPSTLC
eukprot:2370122-Pleurochrysis_carterae.AAC.1